MSMYKRNQPAKSKYLLYVILVYQLLHLNIDDVSLMLSIYLGHLRTYNAPNYTTPDHDPNPGQQVCYTSDFCSIRRVQTL